MAHAVNPGPLDSSILELQQYHVSQHIWNGAPDRTLRVRRVHTGKHEDKHEDPPERILPYLQQAGFSCVVHMGYCPIDHQLITALVERWRPETHTFHMPVGECTITLEDVSVISGLPIDGHALTGRTDYDTWLNKCEELLGAKPTRRDYSGSRIRMSWLAALLQHIPGPENDEGVVQQYARAYMLRFIGGTLFPDHSGAYVHSMFLALLEDFGQAGTYSWGSAALAFLYRELCKATDYDVHDIGGPCHILQFWAWHRFPRLAPSLADPTDDAPWTRYQADRGHFRPLGFKWHEHKVLSDAPQHALNYYRHFFDNLKKNEFVWQPYTEEILLDLPELCVAGDDIRRSLVPLIYFWIVEYHQPDRVLRQFGLDQPIPQRPQQPEHLHSITLQGKTEQYWPHVHRDYIALWDSRRERIIEQRQLPTSLSSRSEYMKWYKKITRRWISRSSASIGVVADIAEQQHLWATEQHSAFSFDQLRQLAETILLALQEHDRVSREQLQQAPPTMTNIPAIGNEDDQDSKKRRRRRTGLAQGRRRVRDSDTSASSSQHATQSEATTDPTASILQTQPNVSYPPPPPPHHYPPPPYHYPYSYPTYSYPPPPPYSYPPPTHSYPYPPPPPPYHFSSQAGTSTDPQPRPPISDALHLPH